MTGPSDVANAVSKVRARIADACRRVGRDSGGVQLLAASKFQPAAAIRAAYAAGQRDFGENYVQELAQKAAELSDLHDLRWHLIGRLQSNKVKDVIRLGCTVQSVDSVKLCTELAKRAAAAQVRIPIYLQVNISDEPQKAGISVAELPQLVAAARSSQWLELRGLMAIPKPSDDPLEARAGFRRVRELAEGLSLPGLSMGMSDDLELAIEEGATLVRVGTALFGERPTSR
jgi:pyridoxal phosphate enzyme (YggS family)